MNLERRPVTHPQDAYEEADPTTYSPAPSAEALTPTGSLTPEKRYPIYTDGMDEYVLLKDRGPRQQVVARLLKGVLNVADVVERPGEKGTEYFSKVMPHDRIEEASSAKDIAADLEVISLVFNDDDRSFRPEGEYMGAHAHNVKYEQGKVSHFDFAEAEFNLTAAMQQRRRYDSPAHLIKVAEKLEVLREKFEGEEGKAHFLSIIAASGKHPAQLFPYSGASDSAESLYEAFVARIDRARAYIEGHLETFERKAA